MTEQFAAAVEAIYDAAADPPSWPRALQAIADCFGDMGAVLIYGKEDGSFGLVASLAIEPMADEYRRDWSHRDVRAIRGREKGYFISHNVLTDRHILSPEEMQSEPHYTEFLAKHGLRYFAATTVSPDPGVEAAISVQRRTDRAEYSDAELVLLGRLGLHVEKSLRLSMRLFEAELSKEGLGVAFEHAGTAIFVLDSFGRVLFSNGTAVRLKSDGIAIRDQRLVTGHMPSQLALQAAVRNLGGGAEAADAVPIIVPRAGGRRPVVLYLLPVTPGAHAMSHFLTESRIIVIAMDCDDSAAADPSLVRDLLGVTFAEAKLASLVGSGLSPQDAAEKLGISVETARTVLKRVFEKVGVSRQSELAILLNRIVFKTA